MDKLNHFFWFCSGVHLPSLQKTPTEHSKYFGIGATIFFTGLFAAISAGYALYFVFSGNLLAPLIALLFGVLWGLAIFNMDRYLVTSIQKSASPFRQFLQALPRILLAIVIGVVISRPLELKIFDKEIKAQLRSDYMKEQQQRIAVLNKNFGDKYLDRIDRLNQAQRERDELRRAIEEDRRNLNFEIFGNKTKETSGIMGYGPYAQRKEEDLKNREAELKQLSAQVEQLAEELHTQRGQEGILEERLLSGASLDRAVDEAGFADRNEALEKLKYDDKGRVKGSTFWAISFIGLLFIFFECLPVFVKLMSSSGPYDQLVADRNETYVSGSAVDKGVDKEVMDQLKKERIEEELVRARALFRKEE